MELRLMDDIVIPSTLAYGPNRPPWAKQARPSAMSEARPAMAQPAVEKSTANGNVQAASADNGPTARFTTLVLKSNQIYEVNRYRINGNALEFRQLNGTEGSVDVNQVDWRRTTEMTAQVRSVDLPEVARQTN